MMKESKNTSLNTQEYFNLANHTATDRLGQPSGGGEVRQSVETARGPLNGTQIGAEKSYEDTNMARTRM